LSRAPVILAAVFLGALCGCRPPRQETVATAERAVLERRRQGLTGLIEVARKGSVLPFDRVLVVADERLVAQVIESSIPFERVILERYRIRVTRAEVHFDDGFALVRLDGEATFADSKAQSRADLTVYGGLDVVELDPDSGLLRGAVNVIAMDARRVNVLGVKSLLAEDLVESLGRERLEGFSALASRIEIPVRLERGILLPAVGPGEVRIDAATVPMRAAVTDVKAFSGKLWVSVNVSADRGPAASPAPATGRPQ
jgi:hypothetical protein